MSVKKMLTVVCDNPHCVPHLELATTAHTTRRAVADAVAAGWTHSEGKRWTYCPACSRDGYAEPEDPYPEHTKLDAVADNSQACAEFTEWLQQEKGVVLCGGEPTTWGTYAPMVGFCLRDLLAEHFEINQAALETEKRAMLFDLRSKS